MFLKYMKKPENESLFKQLPVVTIEGWIYVIEPLISVPRFPYTVVEKTRSGDFTLWQIDNINDTDFSCQYKICGTDNPVMTEDYNKFSFKPAQLPIAAEVEHKWKPFGSGTDRVDEVGGWWLVNEDNKVLTIKEWVYAN